MEFNGKDDHLARGIHGLCAFSLAVISIGLLALTVAVARNGLRAPLGLGAGGIGAAILSFLCARYAITGRNNINEQYMWRGK
ncbi:MAG: hypothetical protein HOQ35_19040 [Acidobacteriaceae bacterium]|nr:hypothetical protein [Acidobacteriaceae bacterium]